MKTTETLFALLRNAVFGTEIDEETKKSAIEKADIIYKIAKHHDLVHLLDNAYENVGFDSLNDDLKKLIKKKHFVAVVRYERIIHDYNEINSVFEQKELDFIPLKGSVIRDLYPEPWMRSSCDIDVLVHEEDLDKASEILVNVLGYEKKESGTHDVSFHSTNGTNIELHYKLSEIYYESQAEQLLDRVWDYAFVKEGCRYHYCLKDEFFYMFHIYHMAKHFEVGGCGIRPFLDLWMLDNKVEHEKDKRDDLLNSIGLLRFAECSRELSRFWFSDGKENEMLSEMQKYLLAGGTYGTTDNRHSVKQAKNQSRFRHLMGRLFLSYDKLKIQYPVIKKHKWLTPFCEVKRWFKLFDPQYRKIAKDDFISTQKPMNDDMSNLLKEIGLY